MKDKDINSAEESELLEEDSTLKGEFITSYFAWVPLNEQKEKVKRLEKITDDEKKRKRKK